MGDRYSKLVLGTRSANSTRYSYLEETLMEKARCPVCGQELDHAGGCTRCPNCGYAECG